MDSQSLLQENIISILGIESLDDERKARILRKATDLVQERLFNKVIDKFSEKQRQEFIDAIDNQNQQKVNSLLEQIDDFEDMLRQEVLQVKQELKDKVSDLDI
ncbi:MAG: DUF5663 domain-containing protein [Candidatus Paceibacteria bacterium]